MRLPLPCRCDGGTLPSARPPVQAIREAGARRLRIMAHAIRHAQRGEIELLRGTHGAKVTRTAVADMLRPAGEVRADGGLGRGEPALALTGLAMPPMGHRPERGTP